MARRLEQCFEELRDDPFSSTNVRPLRGRANMYRYRVGNLRVIFSVDNEALLVRIYAIGPRGDIY
jgi:mRNA interferase RelE/StbE